MGISFEERTARAGYRLPWRVDYSGLAQQGAALSGHRRVGAAPTAPALAQPTRLTTEQRLIGSDLSAAAHLYAAICRGETLRGGRLWAGIRVWH